MAESGKDIAAKQAKTEKEKSERDNYETQLDTAKESLAKFDGDNTLVCAGANANEILVPKMSMSGLVDYNRNAGFTSGNVTFEYETKKCGYEAPRRGAGIEIFDSLYEKDNSVYKALIDRDTLRNMYNAGAQETEAQYVKSMEQSGNTVARRGTGRVYVYEKNGPVTDLTEEKSYTDRSGEEMYYLPLVKAFAKATNTDIVLSQNEGEKINGYYDRAMQRIVLNANNKEDLYHTLIHEGMGEVLEAFNTKGALKVRSALLKYTAEKYQGDELIRSVEKYQDAYTAVEKTKTVSAAMGEMMNDAMSGIFSSKEGIHDLSEWLGRKQGVKEQKSVLGTLADHFRGIETAMRNLLNRGTLTSSGRHDAMIAEKNASKIRKMILDEMDTAIENAQNAKVDENAKNSAAYSIKAGMTDEQRYNELQNQEIVFAEYDHSLLENSNVDLDTLQRNAIKECKPVLRELAKNLGISDKTYSAPDIDFEMGYSRNGVKESINKQDAILSDDKFTEFAKMLTVADKILKNSHLIQVHNDSAYLKQNPDHKTNLHLKNTYELVSGFTDNESVVPVKITVKEFDNIYSTSGVYVMMTLPKIHEGSLARVLSGSDLNQTLGTHRPPSIYRLANVLSAVKNDDTPNPLKRYIPEQFVKATKSLTTGDESARQQAISSLEDVKFSLNDVDMPTDEQMLKPFDEMTDEEYRQAVNVISSVLGSRGQSVEGVHISKDATYRIAQDIIKQTGSSYGINALAENLGKIYSFVEASGKKINYNDLMRLVRQVAVPVIDHAELTEAEAPRRGASIEIFPRDAYEKSSCCPPAAYLCFLWPTPLSIQCTIITMNSNSISSGMTTNRGSVNQGKTAMHAISAAASARIAIPAFWRFRFRSSASCFSSSS